MSSLREYSQSRTAGWGRLCAIFCAVFWLGGIAPVGAQQTDPAPAASSQERVTLNFTDTDITAVINAVAEMTGRNFIIDPRVKGKVTVISTRSLTPDAVFEVFLSLLKVHGFAAIPGDHVTKIVPDVNAKQDAVPNLAPGAGGEGDAFVTQVVPIQHVDAAQLVPILRPLVPQRGHLAAYPPSNVLIISDSVGNIARIADIISRIDMAVHDEVEVIRLQHASAAEVVRTLGQLAGQTPKAAGGAQPFNVIADERTNSVLLGGDKSSRLRVRALISHLDTPIEAGGATQVIYLRFANAAELVPVLTGVSENAAGQRQGQQQQQQASAQRENVIIQADENTNALVITAPPDVFRSLRSVIRQLDVRRAQVLVEAVIAEVSATKAVQLGVQWLFDGTNSGDNAIGVIDLGDRPIRGALENPASLVGSGLNLAIGDFSGGSLDWAAFIRTLSSDTNANILSTPSLVTMDNEEAEIVVGQNVPFVTGTYSTTATGGGLQNPFQTIQRQDIGVRLRIKPQINEGNAIRLQIEQETSSVSEAVANAADIITNKRSIQTNVMIDDGQVLVLGGLIEERLTESQQQVPLLGDIPGLGWLFKYKSNTKEKTNLMVFLRPVILKDAAVQARQTGEKYSYMRAQQLAEMGRGARLIPDGELPLLPEIENFINLPPPYDRFVEGREEPDFPPAVIDDDPIPPAG